MPLASGLAPVKDPRTPARQTRQTPKPQTPKHPKPHAAGMALPGPAGLDPATDPRLRANVRALAQAAKHALSDQEEVVLR